MDPDANLQEQREVTRRLLAAFDAADPDSGEWQPDLDDVYRLAELTEALDGWLSREGALPSDWQSGADQQGNWWEALFDQ
jgi:hypothetical protein